MKKAQQILQLKKKKEQSAALKEAKKQTEVIEKEQQQIEEVMPKKKNMFAAFSDDSQQETKQKQQTKQEKQQENKQEQVIQNKKKKKKAKKNKDQQQINEQDQIDKLFSEVGLNNLPNEQKQKEQSSSTIFFINQNKFNYQNQLKKYFKSIDEQQPVGDNKQTLNKKQKRYQKMLQNIKMKKSILIPATVNYFPISEKFQFIEKQGVLWIEASQKYSVLQEQYQAIKNSNDIQEMFDFLQKNPYHTDAIYNIGQYFRLKGNYKQADQLIQRIIYIYQYSSQYNIGLFVKQNHPHKQIAYSRYSISLFMSLFKFIDILGKKGCYRAGLQYCKFLLKLNLQDPSACLLTLDYNALSAKQYQYLIDFTNNFSKAKGKEYQNKFLYWLPNFIYSFALAKFLLQTDVASKSLIEDTNIQKYLSFTDKDVESALDVSRLAEYDKQSIQVLILRAILLYPRIFADFAEKNDYSKQHLSHSTFTGYQKGNFKLIKEHKFFEQAPTSYFYTFLNIESESASKGLGRVIECYVTRSHILWKNNKVMLWIKAATGFLLNYIDSHQNFNYSQFQQTLSIKSKLNQHISSLCIDLSKYQNVSKSNFMSNVQRIDLNNIQDNQGFQQPQQPQNYNPVNINQNPFQLFLNTLLPWVHLPQQGQNQAQNQEQDPDMPVIEQQHPN